MFIVGRTHLDIYELYFAGSPKAKASTEDDDYDDVPKIKEVADGPYYDQFEYNVTRNYTVIAGMPAEILCKIKMKPSDGNKTVSCELRFNKFPVPYRHNGLVKVDFICFVGINETLFSSKYQIFLYLS